MRIRWLAAVLVAVAVSGQSGALPVMAGERILVQQNFEGTAEQPPGVWALEGQWELAQRAGGVLRQANEDITSDSWALLTWSNYTVSTKGMVEEGAGEWGLGVMGYVDTAGQGYRLRASEGQLYIEKVTTGGVQVLAVGEARARRGKWLSLKLALLTQPEGVSLSGRAWSSDEDEPKEYSLRAQDLMEPVGGGAVGLWVGGAGGQFAFVQVRALAGPSEPTGEAIYSNDFTQTPQGRLPDGWAAKGGVWVRDVREKRPVLRQLAEPVPTLYDDNATAWLQWTGYVSQVRAIAHPGPGRWGFGLVSYYSAQGSNYRLRTLDNKAYLVKRRPDGRVVTMATATVPLQRGRWYQLKLATENLAEVTLLHGKIWEEGQPEPHEWTINAVDRDSPLRQGWPGLWTFGTAVDFDDFSVRTTPLSQLNATLF